MDVIIVPGRLAATRFPNKPLTLIAGKEMIIRCIEQGLASDIAPVYAAVGDKQIYDCVRDYGYNAIMTDPDLPSGTDRIYAALHDVPNNDAIDIVINLQGDLPTIDPNILRDLRQAHHDIPPHAIDIATPVVAMRDALSVHNPNIVKAITHFDVGQHNEPALYFTRSIAPWVGGAMPHDNGVYEQNFYHHLGVYAYRKQALHQFVQAPPHPLEKREGLEQLRALMLGQKIWAVLADTIPQSVDIPDDVQKVEQELL